MWVGEPGATRARGWAPLLSTALTHDLGSLQHSEEEEGEEEEREEEEVWNEHQDASSLLVTCQSSRTTCVLSKAFPGHSSLSYRNSRRSCSLVPQKRIQQGKMIHGIQTRTQCRTQ